MALVTQTVVENPATHEALIATGLTNNSKHDLFKLTGPGLFLAVRVFMSATNGNFTTVTVKIDGKTLINESFSSYTTFGITAQNPFGAMVTHGSSNNAQVMTFGMPYPLRFKQELLVSVTIGGFSVQQINAEVMTGL